MVGVNAIALLAASLIGVAASSMVHIPSADSHGTARLPHVGPALQAGCNRVHARSGFLGAQAQVQRWSCLFVLVLCGASRVMEPVAAQGFGMQMHPMMHQHALQQQAPLAQAQLQPYAAQAERRPSANGMRRGASCGTQPMSRHAHR